MIKIFRSASNEICTHWWVETETEDGSDEEAVEGEYDNAKASKKKGRKKEDRQAQRQVHK